MLPSVECLAFSAELLPITEAAEHGRLLAVLEITSVGLFVGPKRPDTDVGSTADPEAGEFGLDFKLDVVVSISEGVEDKLDVDGKLDDTGSKVDDVGGKSDDATGKDVCVKLDDVCVKLDDCVKSADVGSKLDDSKLDDEGEEIEDLVQTDFKVNDVDVKAEAAVDVGGKVGDKSDGEGEPEIDF